MICDGGILKVNERLEPYPELVQKGGSKPRLQHVVPVSRVMADQYLVDSKAKILDRPT